MASRTRSNNPRASLALLCAVLAALTVPAAVALSRYARGVRLLDAAYAIPFALAFAVAAFAFRRGARGRLEWTLGRAGGTGRLRAAKLIAVLGICIALSSAIAVGFYELLVRLEA